MDHKFLRKGQTEQNCRDRSVENWSIYHESTDIITLQALAIFIHGMPEGDILQRNNRFVVGLNELWNCDCSPLHNRLQ